PVPEIRGVLPEVSWPFFKAVRAGLAVKRPYLSHTGRASNAEKRPTGPGPKSCDENGPATALLVGHVSVQICSLLRQSVSDRLAGGPFSSQQITSYSGDRTLAAGRLPAFLMPVDEVIDGGAGKEQQEGSHPDNRRFGMRVLCSRRWLRQVVSI